MMLLLGEEMTSPPFVASSPTFSSKPCLSPVPPLPLHITPLAKVSGLLLENRAGSQAAIFMCMNCSKAWKILEPELFSNDWNWYQHESQLLVWMSLGQVISSWVWFPRTGFNSPLQNTSPYKLYNLFPDTNWTQLLKSTLSARRPSQQTPPLTPNGKGLQARILLTKGQQHRF